MSSRAHVTDMASDTDAMQQKIQIARRDAEALKDKIKRKKDDLANTTRELRRTIFYRDSFFHNRRLNLWLTFVASSDRRGQATDRTFAKTDYKNEADIKRPFGEDLRNALVNGSKTSCLSVAGRQAHHLGRLHNKQSPCHSSTIIMGHDLRLFSVWKLCSLRGPGQHLLHIQSFIS